MTGPGGVPVKGSRYAPNKRRFRRRFYPRGSRPSQDKSGESSGGPTSEGEGTTENEGPQGVPRRRRPRRRTDSLKTDVRINISGGVCNLKWTLTFVPL